MHVRLRPVVVALFFVSVVWNGCHTVGLRFVGQSVAQAATSSAHIAQPPTVPISEEEVVRGDASRPWVSLVINAGAGHTPATDMLETLRDRQVTTTFFLMGWWAERQPELVA